MSAKKKDPLLAAAVIKVSWEMRGPQAKIFEEIYQGVLRDHGLSEEQVEAYLEKNRAKVEALAKGSGDAAS
ncbi:MAG: hypothetical protein P1V51_05730 [Deltaproteobacteria bacterium]|nr:hypothetical protein [Deltaproteobacteria bacterium]